MIAIVVDFEVRLGGSANRCGTTVASTATAKFPERRTDGGYSSISWSKRNRKVGPCSARLDVPEPSIPVAFTDVPLTCAVPWSGHRLSCSWRSSIPGMAFLGHLYARRAGSSGFVGQQSEDGFPSLDGQLGHKAFRDKRVPSE